MRIFRSANHLLTVTTGICLLLLTACDLRFAKQEVSIRHFPGQDRVEVLLVYQGVTAGSNGLPKAVEAAEAILAGKDECMVVDWPLYFNFAGIREDLMETINESAEDTTPGELAEAKAFHDLAAHFEITRVGLFLDEADRLCGYQVLVIRNVQEVIAAFNDWMHRDILSGSYADDSDLEEHDFSFRTYELLRQKAEAQTPWLALDQGVFSIDIPMATDDADRTRRWLFREFAALEGEDLKFVPVLTELLAHVNGMQYSDENFHIELRGNTSPRIELELEICDVEYDSTLRNELNRLGHEPDPALDLEQVRSLIRSL